METFGPNYRGDPRTLSLVTDSDGRFRFRAVGLVIFSGISKAGYYKTSVTFKPEWIDKYGKVDIPLLRKINPQPMVGKSVNIELVVGYSVLQYDFLKGDCLPPLGKGEIPDLQIEWTRPAERGAEACRRAFRSQLLGENNGLVLHRPLVDPEFVVTQLRSAQEAPSSGYEPSSDFGNHFRGGKLVAYFRIRSGLSGGPRYGRLLDPISYWAAEDQDRFEFEYALNSTGGRSVEMDMSRITVPNRGRLERRPEEF